MRRAVMASAGSIALASAVATATYPTNKNPPAVFLAAAAAAAAFFLTTRAGFAVVRPPSARSAAASSTRWLRIWNPRSVAPRRRRPHEYYSASLASLRALSTLLVAGGGGGRPNSFLTMMEGASALSPTFPDPPESPYSNQGSCLAGQLHSVSPKLRMRIVDETDSTQDEARRLLQELSSASSSAAAEVPSTPTDPEGGKEEGSTDPTCWPEPSLAGAYAVMARRQSSGRGTQGRTWEAGAGNLFLTICLPMDAVPVRITLLPLQVAVLVAQLVHGIVASQQSSDGDDESHPSIRRTTVKWPNDVLVDQRKISGTLIENVIVRNEVWLLIGIGINVESAPVLNRSSPGRHGRPSVSLRDAVGSSDVPLPSALELGTKLASQLVDWAYLADDDYDENNERSTHPQQTRAVREAKVIEAWKEFAVWGTRYELRGRTVEEETSPTFRGEAVTTLDIESDGQLLVADSAGAERRLVADYLF